LSETAAPTVLETLDALAAAEPGRVAVIDHGRRIPYGALALASRRMAAWLLRQGIAPGDRVGLTLREDLWHLLATLGLLRIGCAQVTLGSHDPPAMRAAFARRLGVAVALGESAADALPGISLLLPDIAGIIADRSLDGPLPALAEGTLILTSSGTTGRPKVVEMTARVLAEQAALTRDWGRVRHRIASAEFNNGKRHQMQVLAVGGTEVLVNNARDRPLAEVCAAFGVDRVDMAPLVAERLLAELARPGATPWPPGAMIMMSGARAPAALRAELQARVTRLVGVNLGCTEAGGIAIAGPDDHAVHPETVGFPFAGTRVEVVDDAGRALPPNEPGRVRVTSRAIVAGYLDDPEATARAFRDGWFLPGDAGWFTPEGALVLAGRADDMMNLGTIKIFPAEIEAAAEGFPGLVDCAAFARASTFGDIPLLAVVARDGFDAAALLEHCRARLGLRAPRGVVVLPALPRNAAGKVVRRDLAALAVEAT
jgi:acyl-CoA synthetase (AMP-forming)/AMP-acid ligase II